MVFISPYASIWILMFLMGFIGPNASLGVLIGPYGSLCVLMGRYMSLCVLKDSNGSL